MWGCSDTDASFTLSFIQSVIHAPRHLQGQLGQEHEASVPRQGTLPRQDSATRDRQDGSSGA